MTEHTENTNGFAKDQTGLPWGLTSTFVVWLAVLLGGGLRLAIVLSADFPHNDGGLFNIITQELISRDFHMPVQTAYNHSQLPFVYPPLGFYLAGIISRVCGISVIELQRWLPLVFSILTIPAFWLLSRSMIKKSSTASLATLAFALLPTSIDRLLMGGGLTRAPGFLFSLLALAWIFSTFQQGTIRNLFFAILFSALTCLTHPVYAVFVIFSAVVFYLFASNKKRNLLIGLVIGAGVILITAPWWLSITQIHGPAPLLGALQSRNALPLIMRLSQLLIFDLTGEYFLEIIGVISLLGLISTLLERDYLWLVWMISIFVFEQTSPVSLAIVPLAILAGIGGTKMVSVGEVVLEIGSHRRFVTIAFSLLVYYSLISSYLRFDAPVLTPEIRQGMAWVAENTPRQSKFLVLTPFPWWDDPTTEWFPALTNRISVTTVQGYEWTSTNRFTSQIQRFDAAQGCLQSIQIDCLVKWTADFGQTFGYIFIAKISPPKNRQAVEISALVQSLRHSSDYFVIYEEAGAILFERR